VRIAKLYKYAYKGIEARLQQSQTLANYERDLKNEEALNKLEGSQEDQEEIEVLQYNQKMIPKPRMMPSVQPDSTRGKGGESERNPISTTPQHSTIRVELTHNDINKGGSHPDQKTIRAQLIEIGEKPIHYEEQNSDDSQSEKNLEEEDENGEER
jgi:hypothetical protein